jgi:ubiquinone/menaquinone biosynthesis C-methylase UbiE
MWAIASFPGRKGMWTEEAFFESGRGQVAAILAGIESLGLELRTGRALDYGCGLGRVSRALGERFAEVWGVDISPGMIEQARRLNGSQSACRFAVNDHGDLREIPSNSFDLVCCLVTLQHVPDRNVIGSYMREFVRVASPGGVIVFQLPTRVAWRVRLRPRTVIARAIWRLPSQPAVVRRFLGSGSRTLTALPEQSVRDILTSSGAEIITAFPENSVGSDQVPSICYIARK